MCMLSFHLHLAVLIAFITSCIIADIFISLSHTVYSQLSGLMEWEVDAQIIEKHR
jgi:hypothetical protein